MTLTALLALLESIYTTLSPVLKPLEEEELAALKVKYAGRPLFLLAIDLAAKVVG